MKPIAKERKTAAELHVTDREYNALGQVGDDLEEGRARPKLEPPTEF